MTWHDVALRMMIRLLHPPLQHHRQTSIIFTTPALTVAIEDMTLDALSLLLGPGAPNVTYAGAWLWYPHDKPVILSVTPGAGPAEGGTSIVIRGSSMCSNDTEDIVDVRVCGASVPQVISVDRNAVTALTPALVGDAPKACTVEVESKLEGISRHDNAFVYYVPPTYAHMSPSAGPPAGGQEVCVTGTHFVSFDPSEVFEVTVGGRAAPRLARVSATEVCFVTPAGTGVAQVVLKSRLFGDLKTGTYTYYNGGKITGITPARCTVLGGCHVTIEGSGLFEEGETPEVRVGGAAGVVVRAEGGTTVVVEVPAAESDTGTENKGMRACVCTCVEDGVGMDRQTKDGRMIGCGGCVKMWMGWDGMG